MYSRSRPADVSPCAATMAPGNCSPRRRAMFDGISVRSSLPVYCDAGSSGLWSWSNPRLKLRGSHL
jgi:hypothetical protein